MSVGTALREVFARFTMEADPSKLVAAGSAADGLVGKLEALGAVFAGSRIVSAVTNFGRAVQDQASQISNAATILGTTTDGYQRLAYAAHQADLDTGAFAAATARLEQSAELAAAGTGAQADAFRQLGVQVRDATGHARGAAELYPELAHAFGQVTNASERLRLAQVIGGRQFRTLLPILHDGAGGLAAYGDEFERLGGGLSAEAIARAGEYETATKQADVAVDSLRSTLAVGLLPWLTRATEKVIQGIGWLRHLTETSHVLEHGLSALKVVVGAFAIQMALANLPVILGAAAVLLLALAYDDVATAMEGGNSALGHWIDKNRGAGATVTLARNLRMAWEGVGAVGHDLSTKFGQFFDNVRIGAAGIRDAFAPVTAWVSEHFGGMIDGLTTKVNELLRLVGLAAEQTADNDGTTVTHLHVGGRMVNGRMTGGRSVTTGSDSGESEGASEERNRGAAMGVFQEFARGFNGLVTAGLVGDRGGILDQWRAMATAQAPGAAPQPVAVSAGHGAMGSGQTTTVHNTTHVTIPIHGATDPHAVRRQVVAALQDVARSQAAEHDADHPTGTAHQ